MTDGSPGESMKIDLGRYVFIRRRVRIPMLDNLDASLHGCFSAAHWSKRSVWDAVFWDLQDSLARRIHSAFHDRIRREEPDET